MEHLHKLDQDPFYDSFREVTTRSIYVFLLTDIQTNGHENNTTLVQVIMKINS